MERVFLNIDQQPNVRHLSDQSPKVADRPLLTARLLVLWGAGSPGNSILLMSHNPLNR
jgi:hypothetical protein